MASSAGLTTAGTPAPYGRACTNCVKAKCKCFYRGSGRELATCERCHRLGKECVVSDTVRKRSTRRPNSSRTAQLEEKLDDLVSLLKTQQQQSGAAPSNTSELSVAQDSHISHNNVPRPPSQPVTGTATSSTVQFLFPASSNNATESTGDVYGDSGNPPNAAARPPGSQIDQEFEECLKVFSKHCLAFFPFFHVPERMTAHQLQHDRPTFALAIKSVVCKVHSRQVQYAEQLQQELAQKTLVEYENSLDLLLALITYLGWAHFHETRKPFTTVMTRLAISQVIELGLHRTFGEMPAVAAFRKARPFVTQEPARSKPNNEQRRAALGCYFITSSAFTSNRRAEGLRWTAYLEEMLLDLTNAPECQGDEVLVAHVKLQQIQEQLYNARIQPGDLGATNPLSRGLPLYYTNLLKQSLRSVQSGLSTEISTDVPVDFMQQFIELIIAESAVDYKELPFSKSSTTKQGTESTSARQLEGLAGLVEALDRFFKCFYNITPEHAFGMSYAFAGIIPYGLCTLLKLSISQADSVWDPHEVRRRMDILSIVDQLAVKLLAVPSRMGLLPGEVPAQRPASDTEPIMDIFSKCGPILAALRAGWEAELRKHITDPSTLPNPDWTTGLSVTVNEATMMSLNQQSYEEGYVGSQMNPIARVGGSIPSQQPNSMSMFMPQYDASSWLTFHPSEQLWSTSEIF